MNKKKFSILLTMLLLISTVLCGCSDSMKKGEDNQTPVDHNSLETPNYGGSIVVGITQDLDSLDPHKAVAAGTKEVLFNIFEGLVKPDKDGNLVPAIASDYSISPDGTVYTFTLREGVKFHDGTLVTAEDVIYSIKRSAGMLDYVDPEVRKDTALSCIESITASKNDKGLDEVVLVLKVPNIELIGYLTVNIIPENYDNQAVSPIGTGPFKFVSYTPLGSIVMEKNDDYYIKGIPYLDEVTFKISASTEAAFFELLAGAIDIFPYLTAEQSAQLSDMYEIKTGQTNLVQGLFLNNDAEPFNNKLIRQALFYAIDAEEILLMIGGGSGSVIRSNMFHGFAKYYNSELDNTYAYDTEKALNLLEQAGYPDGFSFTIKVPSNYHYHVDTAQVVVEQLKRVGIKAEIQLIEWASWLSDVYAARDYEATIIGLAAMLAPSDVLKRYQSTASNNFINYKSDLFDTTFTKAYQSVDDLEKIQLYKELQKILNEDAASVYIQDQPLMTAVNKTIRGYEFFPVYVQDMSTVYIAK